MWFGFLFVISANMYG